MKNLSPIYVLVAALALLAVACSLTSAVPSSAPSAGDIATRVAGTLQALSSPTGPAAPLASPTEAAPTTAATATGGGQPSATPAATSTEVPNPGSIEGSISGYPYGALGQLTIVAYEQESPYNYSYWLPNAGSTSYSMTSEYLVPGKWQVVAYDHAGHAGGCPTIVTVKPDESATCDITDWSGAYRAKPAGVP